MAMSRNTAVPGSVNMPSEARLRNRCTNRLKRGAVYVLAPCVWLMPTAGASMDDLTTALSASIEAGADFLLHAISETNGWTFALTPPEVPHGSIPVRQVTNTYTQVTVEYRCEPRVVYYEEYETQVQKPSESAGMPGEVVIVKKRRRINSPAEARNPRYVIRTTECIATPDGSRTHTRTQLRPDPNGTIVRVHTVQQRGVAAYWPTGFLGQNAMALLALLKSGVPENHEPVEALTRSLAAAVRGYGAPDTTWDLAWLAAAFAHLDNSDYHALRDLLLIKLLDGQITTRPARGLWGPVCVNIEMLGLFLAHFQAVMAREQARPNPDNDLQFIELGTLGRLVAQQGLRFLDVQKWYELGLNEWNLDAQDVIIEGLPYVIYTEMFADLESTAVALFALREAAARGVLPAETQRPAKAPGRQAWPRPERVDGILARTGHALSQLQTPEGGWPEANIQQPVPASRALQIGGLPPFDPLPFPDARSAVSTVRGGAAIEWLAAAVGPAVMRNRYGRNLELSHRARVALANRFLADPDSLETPPHSHFLPEEFVFHLTGLYRSEIMAEERDRALWQQVAIRLIERQSYLGEWPYGRQPYAVKSTSIWRQLEPRERVRLANPPPGRRERDPVMLPPDSAGFYSAWMAQAFPRPARDWWWERRTQPVLLRESVIPTALAMLFLLDGLQAPVAAYLVDDASPAPGQLLVATIGALGQRLRLDIKPTRITSSEHSAVQGRPVLFVDKAGILDDAAARDTIGRALLGGATLVLEASADEQTVNRIAVLLPGSRVERLTTNLPVLARWHGTMPPLSGILRPDGSLAAVFLPWQAQSATPAVGMLSGQDALQVAFLLLADRASRPPVVPWRGFAAEGEPGATIRRDRALSNLRRPARQPAPPDVPQAVPITREFTPFGAPGAPPVPFDETW